MLMGMTAASSAIDLINSLTKSGSSTSTGTTGFLTPASASAAGSASTGTSTGAGTGLTSLIAPDTMNALFAAQGSSDPSTTSQSSRSGALKDLFNLIDSNGDGSITKSEFENALGAGGTNIANADSVFDKLDSNGDGSVSKNELSAALKGGHHHAHGSKGSGGSSGGGGGGGGEDALMQAIDGANANTVTNSDGSTTSTVTYADGSTVTMTTPAAASSSSTATRSYNAIEQMFQQQVNMLSKGGSVSSSVSVSA